MSYRGYNRLRRSISRELRNNSEYRGHRVANSPSLGERMAMENEKRAKTPAFNDGLSATSKRNLNLICKGVTYSLGATLIISLGLIALGV